MEDSPALGLGLSSIPMDNFGVLSPWLQDVAEKVKLPLIQEVHHGGQKASTIWLGAKLRNVSGLGDRSAYGLEDESEVIVESIDTSSVLAKSGLQSSDVIRSMDGKGVRTWEELLQVYQGIRWKGKARLTLIRNQKSMDLEVEGL